MKLARTIAFMATAGLLCVPIACGTADSDSTEQNPQVEVDGPVSVSGLSILEADEEAGKVVAQFEKNGRTIKYELRLGPKMATPPSSEELATNPELPSYEVDARVVDAKGQPFHVQVGGHDFIDSAWSSTSNADVDVPGRLQDIRMLREAVPALRKLKFRGDLEQLRFSAIQMGLTVEDTPSKPGLVDPKMPGSTKTQAELERGPLSVAKWDYRIMKKNQLGGVGHHSAVHLRGWTSTGSIVFNKYSCNHGACASASNMTQHCVMSGFRNDDGTHSRYFYGDMGCSTSYDWDSSAIGGAHNCNDDTELQINAIYHDRTQDRRAGSCSAIGFHNWAPGCH